MHASGSPHHEIERREAVKMIAAFAAACAVHPFGQVHPTGATPTMTIACFIRYQIDPFQADAFRQYAEAWGTIIPRCGGHLIGYFMPNEGTNDIAWGLIAFDSLASYERYRATLRTDEEAQANFRMAQSKRCVLREERTFVTLVDGTFDVPAQPRR